LPATIVATISAENSRASPSATPSTTKMFAPYCSACSPSRYATTSPMRKVTSATTGIADAQTCENWANNSLPRRFEGFPTARASSTSTRPKYPRWPCNSASRSAVAAPSDASGPRGRGAAAASRALERRRTIHRRRGERRERTARRRRRGRFEALGALAHHLEDPGVRVGETAYRNGFGRHARGREVTPDEQRGGGVDLGERGPVQRDRTRKAARPD